MPGFSFAFVSWWREVGNKSAPLVKYYADEEGSREVRALMARLSGALRR
jgi:hypothetical protein